MILLGHTKEFEYIQATAAEGIFSLLLFNFNNEFSFKKNYVIHNY